MKQNKGLKDAKEKKMQKKKDAKEKREVNGFSFIKSDQMPRQGS